MSSIYNLYSEWLDLLPLKEEDQKRLDRKFMLEFNYNSNHIEGNTLTYGQTEFLLLFGRAIDNANMRDLEEMKASNVCLQMVKEEAKDKERHLTENFIRNLHKTLLREDYTVSTLDIDKVVKTYTVHAGIYKTRPNSVITRTGEFFSYASPEETPSLMADLLLWYNKAETECVLSPIELAALFHYRYIRIHPFEDGNGRISRLIVNYILAKHGYPMIVVKSADKDNYIQALNMCDITTGSDPTDGANAAINQIKPLVDYLSRCLERALVVCIKAAKGENIEDPDDFTKQLSLIEKGIRKYESIKRGSDSIQDKINVFNNFHRILASKLLAEIRPVHMFFTNVHIGYFMSKEKRKISLGGVIQLKPEVPLTRDVSDDKLEIIKDAQSILLNVFFDGVKLEYNMKDVHIDLQADVQFDLQSYCFDGEDYLYDTYPDIDTINTFINKKKTEILNIIQKAANNKVW